MSENALFQGYFTEVSFDTSEGNQLSHFQNGYISTSASKFIKRFLKKKPLQINSNDEKQPNVASDLLNPFTNRLTSLCSSRITAHFWFL